MRLAIAALCLLVGCASTAPERPAPDLSVPAAWTEAAAGGAIAGAWWREFDDPRLDGLIAEAVRANRDLKAAAARVAAAAAEARIAGADLSPQLSMGFQAARARQNVPPPAPAGSVATASSFGASLDVSWEVDLWGRLRAGAQGAVADLEAQRADYAAAALSLAARTARAWYGLTEARLQVALAQATATSYGETAARAADRVAAGVQAPTDRHLADSNHATAQAVLQQREEALRRATRQLETLLGRYPAGRIEAGGLPRVEPLAAAGVPAQMLGRRPDLRALENRMSAAGLRIDASRAALLPRLSLSASAGAASSELSDLFSGKTLWSIAGNVVQPIIDGGRLRARVDAAEARHRELLETYAQRALDAFAEVETTLAIGDVLGEREAALVRAVKAAREAVTIAENRYREGVESLLLVLESQRRAYDAESALLAARRQRIDARIDLHLALGDGYEELLKGVQP